MKIIERACVVYTLFFIGLAIWNQRTPDVKAIVPRDWGIDSAKYSGCQVELDNGVFGEACTAASNYIRLDAKGNVVQP
jgi:hypothetical protein